MAEDENGERLAISTHRELLTQRKAIVARLEARQDVAVLLLLNPVLALREVGVDLTPPMADHVLRAVRHPPKVDARRSELEESLTAKLGERPKPNDAVWLAETLFTKLGIEALATDGQSPAYVDPMAVDKAWLASLLPTVPRFAGATAEPLRGTRIALAPYKPTIRRLDLEAPVPALEPATRAPTAVSLETLWFYKNDPVARDLLELGMIEKSALSIHTGDSFRAIQAGAKTNAFTAWIRSVHFDRS